MSQTQNQSQTSIPAKGTSYKDLIAQRENLEKQIAQARTTEIGTAVAQIKQLMSDYDLTAADVFPNGRAGSSGKASSASKGATVAAKYRDSATGQTWTGRGKAPIWIRDKDREQFLIPA